MLIRWEGGGGGGGGGSKAEREEVQRCFNYL